MTRTNRLIQNLNCGPTRWVKAFPTKIDDLSSIPEMYRVKERTNSYKLASDPCHGTHTYTQSIIPSINVIKIKNSLNRHFWECSSVVEFT